MFFAFTEGSLQCAVSSDAQLQRYAEKVQLVDILIFATGCSEVPAAGFSTLPKIKFVHAKGRFPSANTCCCWLYLIAEDMEYEQFVMKFLTALLNGKDFSTI